VANTQAYYSTELITAVKSFMVQAPGVKYKNFFLPWSLMLGQKKVINRLSLSSILSLA
jgi:hypothetical protein